MSNLKEYIKDKRSNLSNSSLTTYTSILRSLYKKIYGNEDIDYSKFNNTDKILEYLKDITPNKRKTILSALVIITDNKKYRELMLEDVRDHNKDILKQEKTDSQKENWVTQNEVDNMYNALKQTANIIYKKQNITNNDLQIIQNFIILALFKLIAPRRSKDYVDFKIKNVDKSKDNYMEKGKFIFNSYKTAKTYGRQDVSIPRELTTIINKWIKVNPTDYLLFDTNMNPLTAVKFNQRFNKIFDGKKISTNAMRHSYLTEKYADTIKANDKMNNELTSMGTSNSQAKVYIKLD
jgi:hypothetical protein